MTTPDTPNSTDSLLDRDRILVAAIHAFATHGYLRASLADLEKAAGVDREILHDQFGTKRHLLDECIQFYREVTIRQLVERARTEPDPLLAIGEIFDHFSGDAADPGSRLLVWLLMEFPGNLPIEIHAAEILEELEEILRERLGEARETGKLALDGIGVAALAGAAACSLLGIATTRQALRKSLLDLPGKARATFLGGPS